MEGNTLSKRERDWVRRGIQCTDNQYDRLRQHQNFRCNICGEHESDTGSLHIDHCHVSGRIRGLLCGKCNRGVGLLGDDVESVERALNHILGFHLQKEESE